MVMIAIMAVNGGCWSSCTSPESAGQVRFGLNWTIKGIKTRHGKGIRKTAASILEGRQSEQVNENTTSTTTIKSKKTLKFYVKNYLQIFYKKKTFEDTTREYL